MFFMMGFLITLIVSLSSCRRQSERDLENEKSLDEIISCTNPRFTSVIDIVCVRDSFLSHSERDSIFRSLDKETLINVCLILIYRYGSCTIQDIIDEYHQHKDIYDGIESRAETDSDETGHLP